ncbi:MAG TPA: hypothetical protein PKL15_03415 [Saprospiraceae bacterium]|nr:hypothetical protein [Saprospiraceae bacterium]HNM24447.1 hypothetical protein [Saprospiraceae bacterium]
MENKPGPVFYATALAGVVVFFGLIGLYVREFPVLFNTIDVGRLVGIGFFGGAVLAAALLCFFRARLTPWERHLPELMTILVFTVLFGPLMASLLNRLGGKSEYQSFEFLAEAPYLSSNYGLLKGEKMRPTGYYLDVRENGRLLRFKYKTQAYYPNTRPGEPVLLPVRRGVLGFRVMTLE